MTQEQDRILEIIDLAETGQVQVALTTAQDRRTAPPVSFDDLLADSDLQEIGWYFTEYLRNPFGDAKARAEAVETRFRALGRALFETVFQSSDDARVSFRFSVIHSLYSTNLQISKSAKLFTYLHICKRIARAHQRFYPN